MDRAIGHVIARIAALGICLMPAPSIAQDEVVDRRIPYQGRLEGVTGSVSLLVELYDAFEGGNRVWGPETHPVTPDVDGRFMVVLGATGLDVCARQPDESLVCGSGDGLADLDQIDMTSLHLSIEVEDGATTTALTPRQELFPSFGAATATVADLAIGVAADAVGSLEIVDASVAQADLAPDSVVSTTILDRSVGAAELAAPFETGATNATFYPTTQGVDFVCPNQGFACGIRMSGAFPSSVLDGVFCCESQIDQP